MMGQFGIIIYSNVYEPTTPFHDESPEQMQTILEPQRLEGCCLSCWRITVSLTGQICFSKDEVNVALIVPSSTKSSFLNV